MWCRIFFLGGILTLAWGGTSRAQDNSAESQQLFSSSAVPSDAVNFQTFYDSLATEGTWTQTSDYGYVWQPKVDDPNWAPYTDGHWVYTQDGWTWVSNEPWGWATYHYGRWANLDGLGWCWVPGYTWGPAWVSWRYGDGYCGWAPLPPDSLVGVDYDDDSDSGAEANVGIGFHIGGDCDSYYGIGAAWYNFVPASCLGSSSYRDYYVNRYNNYGIIGRTTNLTNVNVTRNNGGGRNFGGVTLGGPSLLQVDSVSQTPVPRVNLVAGHHLGGGTLSGGSLAIYAPRVNAGTAQMFQPQTVDRSVGHLEMNRGMDISHPLMVNSRLGVVGPTGRQIEEGQYAMAHAPAEAKLANYSGNSVPSMSSRPMISMRPMGGSTPVVTREGSPVRGSADPEGSYSGHYSGGGGGSERGPAGPIYSRPSAAPSGGGFRGGGGGFNGGGGGFGGGGAVPGGGGGR